MFLTPWANSLRTYFAPFLLGWVMCVGCSKSGGRIFWGNGAGYEPGDANSLFIAGCTDPSNPQFSVDVLNDGSGMIANITWEENAASKSATVPVHLTKDSQFASVIGTNFSLVITVTTPDGNGSYSGQLRFTQGGSLVSRDGIECFVKP